MHKLGIHLSNLLLIAHNLCGGFEHPSDNQMCFVINSTPVNSCQFRIINTEKLTLFNAGKLAASTID